MASRATHPPRLTEHDRPAVDAPALQPTAARATSTEPTSTEPTSTEPTSAEPTSTAGDQAPASTPAHRVDLSEDRAWLDGFRRGDDAALERVFRCYAPLVVAIVQRGARLNDRFAPGVDVQTQQDLLHDVFVRAFGERARQSYDGLRPYAPFIAQIARRTLVDHHRKVTHQARRTELQPPETLAAFDRCIDDWRPSLPLPDDAVGAHRDRDRVQAFLSTLDDEDRELVRLRFEEGLSQRDTADAAGTSRQRLRTWEQKLRARLRAFLGATERPPP